MSVNKGHQVQEASAEYRVNHPTTDVRHIRTDGNALPLGYKRTEVGVIPEEWEVKAVIDAFDICNNLRFPLSADIRERMSGAYPYYGPTKIQDHINEFRVEGEYALIGEDGDHFLKFMEMPQTQLTSGRFNVNNHAHLVKGKEALTKWFYYYFRNKDITVFLTRQGAGRFKLNKASLSVIPCAIPPSIEEQTAIANALSDVDVLIAALEKLISKKSAIKTAAMQQLLTGKKRLPPFDQLPPTTKTTRPAYKQTELGEIPEDWEVKKFSEIALLKNERINPKITKGGNFCIELEHIKQASGTLEGHTTTTTFSSLKNIFNVDDVLFGKLRSYLRKYWIADTAGVCSTEIWVLTAIKEISIPNFVYQTIQTDRFIESSSESYGTHMPRSDWKVIKDFFVATPSKQEQTAIAKVLSDMDQELQALQLRLHKTQQIKQGMMQELLTGKTRLV